jgi:predicted amidohydrolase
VLVGFVRRNPSPVGRRVHNSLALLVDGQTQDTFDKCLLPTYDVFDEDRYFEAGRSARVANLKLGGQSLRVGVTICEDLWNDEETITRRLYHSDPLAELASAGAQLVVNASASPYEANKQTFRERLLGNQAAARHNPKKGGRVA